VVIVAVSLTSGCRSGHHRSAAYKDGYSHGYQALEAEPLGRNGHAAPRSLFRKACWEVANFYLVPEADRHDWIPGCISGARASMR
jgi:hypothetical protein